MYFLSLAALVLAVLIFTGGFASARFYMEAGGGPQDVVTLRHGISGLLFLPFVVWIWERLREHPGLWRAIGLALCGGVPFGACVFTGIGGAPFSHGGAIVPGVSVLYGTLLAHYWLGEAIGLQRVAGMLVTLIGLGLLVGPEWNAPGVTWWGELAYLGAGFLWATFTVALRAFKASAIEGAAMASVFSLPYLIVYAFLDPQIRHISFETTLIHGLYQGVGFSGIAVMMYAWAVGRLGAASAVAAMPLMPFFATLMEWGFFDRQPSTLAWVALAVMAIGIGLAATAGRASTEKSV